MNLLCGADLTCYLQNTSCIDEISSRHFSLPSWCNLNIHHLHARGSSSTCHTSALLGISISIMTLERNKETDVAETRRALHLLVWNCLFVWLGNQKKVGSKFLLHFKSLRYYSRHLLQETIGNGVGMRNETLIDLKFWFVKAALIKSN